jgi:hypothetical protein
MDVSGKLHSTTAFPQRENHRCPLDMRLDGPLTWSESYGEEKNLHESNRDSLVQCHIVERMGKKRNAYKILAGMPEGKTPLGRARRR